MRSAPSRRNKFVTLSDPYLKTKRAKAHLDSLRNEISAFIEAKPVRLFPQTDTKNGRYLVRIKIEKVPDHIPIIAGDVFYCLRSALDQTVWALAKSRSGSSYPTHTQFPIFDHNTKRNGEKFRNYTTGVPAAAVGILKSLQPYNRANPPDHLLSRLNRLCNIDKHRRIPVHGEGADLTFSGATPELMGVIKFDHEQQMFSVPIAYKGQVSLDPEVSFKIVFGDFSMDPTLDLACDLEGVEKIYEFVANSVIPRFARFFK